MPSINDLIKLLPRYRRTFVLRWFEDTYLIGLRLRGGSFYLVCSAKRYFLRL